jgi:hypothetical protein
LSFAEKELAKYGWAPGKGLGRDEVGIAEPISVARKQNTLGIGATHLAGPTDGWWDRNFSKLLGNVKVAVHSDSESDDKPPKRANSPTPDLEVRLRRRKALMAAKRKDAKQSTASKKRKRKSSSSSSSSSSLRSSSSSSSSSSTASSARHISFAERERRMHESMAGLTNKRYTCEGKARRIAMANGPSIASLESFSLTSLQGFASAQNPLLGGFAQTTDPADSFAR